MDIHTFFNLLLEEIKENSNLRGYYRFLESDNLFEFRKYYYLRRLKYISDQITDKKASILDIGCGYGTTGFFFALNGYKIHGTTLEYYYDQIETRRKYWETKGDISNFSVSYENLLDSPPAKNSVEYIIVQDVLHHLEPIDKALNIIQNTLKANGKLIACEENGKNLLNSLRLFIKRGNKRIIELYDEKLGKKFLMGNENIRSLLSWKRIIGKHGMYIKEDKTSFLRYYFPSQHKKFNLEEIADKEDRIWQNQPWKRDFFFHGVNFTAIKEVDLNR